MVVACALNNSEGSAITLYKISPAPIVYLKVITDKLYRKRNVNNDEK
jgi:hypothetical protein